MIEVNFHYGKTVCLGHTFRIDTPEKVDTLLLNKMMFLTPVDWSVKSIIGKIIVSTIIMIIS